MDNQTQLLTEIRDVLIGPHARLKKIDADNEKQQEVVRQGMQRSARERLFSLLLKAVIIAVLIAIWFELRHR